VLAVSSLLLVWFKPEDVSSDQGLVFYIVILLLAYLGHSIWLLVVVQFGVEVSPRFSILAHATDILWPAVISLFSGGTNSPFFLYFIFALLAAAFRWGMRRPPLNGRSAPASW